MLSTASKNANKNDTDVERKNAELKKLKDKIQQNRKEHDKKVQQKKTELKNLQDKKIQQAIPPTDQEFDAWLENRVRECLTATFRKLRLDDEIINHKRLLRVRGYILPGMRDASHYDSQDLRYKLGADGKRRYSVNLYTYFYPAQDQLMIFTYDINAMNWDDYRETSSEYFYQDVISAKTVDDYDDTLNIDGKPQKYRMQRFSLSFRDGTAISATVRSRPRDNTASLPVFDIPQSDIDETIAQLRLWIRTKKA